MTPDGRNTMKTATCYETEREACNVTQLAAEHLLSMPFVELADYRTVAILTLGNVKLKHGKS